MTLQKPLIIGLSASLRNARFGIGSKKLIEELRDCASKDELRAYLHAEGSFCVEEFVEAGRGDGLSFSEIYRNYQSRKGERGLSNSEVALAAGLWGALQEGADVRHISLDSFFGNRGSHEKQDKLADLITSASGVLLSGPVYFGDRGSLAEDFVRFVRTNDKIRHHMELEATHKLYAGIAVGAKRNGGQETSLIYQLADMSTAGFLCVGNDAASTSQYGGTGWAGDVGTMASDDYGLTTSMGTGRRLASAAKQFTEPTQTKHNPRIAIWLLQDREHFVRAHISSVLKTNELSDDATIRLFDFTEMHARRCIACDICPKEFGPDEEYRCIIKSDDDLFSNLHEELLGFDGIVIAGYSSVEREQVKGVYQRFIERTRYLRRGEYALGNTLVMPLVFEEIGARESLELRMLTSMIRHNTILSPAVTVHLHDGEMLNAQSAAKRFRQFVTNCRASMSEQRTPNDTLYNPVGYALSKEYCEQEAIKRQHLLKTRQTRSPGARV